MELDELKNYLNRQLDHEAPQQTPGEISAMLHQKSLTIVDRIRRSLFIELAITLIAIVFMLYCKQLTADYYIQLYINFFLFIAFIFLFILSWLIRSSYRISPEISSVKTNLSKLHLLIARFTYSYFILTMALFPPVVLYALLVVPMSKSNHSVLQAIQFYFQLPTGFLLLIVLYIVLSGLFLYFFTRWYIRILYGNYLGKLKQLIEELDAAE
jgi:hypothetical protein